MNDGPNTRVPLRLTLRESVLALFRNALKLAVLVVILDFLIWGVAIELPSEYWNYLLWRVPSIAKLSGLLAESGLRFPVELFETSQGWATSTLSRTLHTALYLVAVLNISIIVLHGDLSIHGTIARLAKAKTWEFLQALWRTTWTVLLFVLVATIVTLLPLILVVAAVEMVAFDAARALLLKVVLGVVVVALANAVLSRWLLIGPVCVLESAGFDSFRKSWTYTARSLVEVWLLYTIHTAVFVTALLLIPINSNETALMVLNALLPICVVWHAALSVKCYTAICPQDAFSAGGDLVVEN